MGGGGVVPESTLRCRTEGADIYSAWVNERRAGLRHSLMGKWLFSSSRKRALKPNAGSLHAAPDVPAFLLWLIWVGFARLSCLLNLFCSRLIGALPCGDPGKCRVGAGKAAFVRHTQARRPRHQIHKILDVFMSFYCGLFASHILVHCTNGRIVLIS